MRESVRACSDPANRPTYQHVGLVGIAQLTLCLFVLLLTLVTARNCCDRVVARVYKLQCHRQYRRLDAMLRDDCIVQQSSIPPAVQISQLAVRCKWLEHQQRIGWRHSNILPEERVLADST
jgi:hypothetical protein